MTPKGRNPSEPEPEPEPDLAALLPDVQPLARRDRVPATRAPAPRAPATPVKPGGDVAEAEPDPQVEGHAPNLDPRVLRRLRRGEPAAEETLDLHGLHRDEAERAVRGFLQRSVTSGRRAVRIVHGRGLHSEAGPVLRNEVGRWLRDAVAAGDVLAFLPARLGAGGTGAVHVLLRNKRR